MADIIERSPLPIFVQHEPEPGPKSINGYALPWSAGDEQGVYLASSARVPEPLLSAVLADLPHQRRIECGGAGVCFSGRDLTMGKLKESLPLVTAANPAWVFSQIRERDWYLPALKYGVPALSPPLSPGVAQFMPSLHTES